MRQGAVSYGDYGSGSGKNTMKAKKKQNLIQMIVDFFIK